MNHHPYASSRRLPARRRLALALAALYSALPLLPALAQSPNPPPEQAARELPDHQLPAVEIVGRREAGTYHAGEASGAKTELSLRELPQSVRIITRQAIDDIGATKLDDVLDYVGGVSRQNNFGGLWDNIAIRGLPGHENTGMSTLRNGFSANRGYNAPRDLAGVERVEFLKGPAAALYGSSEPGGTLNIVSKKPLWRAGHALEAYAGSHGHRRAAIDSSAPLGQRFAYRLNIAVEDRDGFRDHVSTARRLLAPAFSWRLGADTSLDYSGEWLSHATPLDRGVVAVGNRLDAIPRSRFLGEPGDGATTVRNERHQLMLTHEWSSGWRARAGLSYLDSGLAGITSQPLLGQRIAADGTIRRQRQSRDYASEDLALQAELQGQLRLAGFEHELLLGLERFHFSLDQRNRRYSPTAAAPYAINIHAPVYGQPLPAMAPQSHTLERQRNNAFYLQDAIKLDPRWRLVAGLRLDHYQQSLLNRLSNKTDAQSPRATSPRIGLSWLPNAQWTVYASAGRSFRPNTGIDADGRPFAPETGRALELGAKWESADKDLGATAALFDIAKRQVLTGDPDPGRSGFKIAAGEMRSRGLELDLAGRIARQWRLNASLVLNSVKISRDNTLEVGGRLLNVPRLTGSLLAVYEGRLDSGRRYDIGAGLTHMGARLGEARTQAEAEAEASAGTPAFELPAYTTAKLVASLRLNSGLRLTLDVHNLFDQTHYTSSYSRLWIAPGAGRSLVAGLQATF